MNWTSINGVVIVGKRTPEQLRVEIRFAQGISSGMYRKIAEEVARLQREGKLVDCA